MEATSPPMRIGRKTILSILKGAPYPKAVVDNPHEFASALTSIIKTKLADQLVGGIKYERDGTWYAQTQFDDLIEAFAENVVKSEANAFAGGTHIYDGVNIDSETIERPFAEALEKDARVKLYVKLPSWFWSRRRLADTIQIGLSSWIWATAKIASIWFAKQSLQLI
ncbi:hypothetical protein HED50_18695 [Ochrobactrum oryzae]|nr:hypothetical protein [Brucella oryzae]